VQPADAQVAAENIAESRITPQRDGIPLQRQHMAAAVVALDLENRHLVPPEACKHLMELGSTRPSPSACGRRCGFVLSLSTNSDPRSNRPHSESKTHADFLLESESKKRIEDTHRLGEPQPPVEDTRGFAAGTPTTVRGGNEASTEVL
jgi:hypothetical protein